MIKRILISALAIIFIIGLLPACQSALEVKAPAKIVVNRLEVTPNETTLGEPVMVRAEISNIGGSADNYTAILNIDGKERDKQIIAIRPSENKTISFTVSESNVGEHGIEIDAVKSTFTVYEIPKYSLKHDNGQPDFYWYRDDPVGLWIRFIPPVVPFQINNIIVAGKRTNFSEPEKKHYTIKIWDKDFEKELYSSDYPYTNFSTETKMVTHEIKPPLIVSNDFTIEFLSHCEAQGSGWPNGKTIAVATDHSVGSSQYIGFSAFGSNSVSGWNSMLQYDPMLVNSSWIIRVEGVGKKAATVTTANIAVDGIGKEAEGVTTKVEFDAKNPVTIQYDHTGEGIQNFMYTGYFVSGGAGHMVWFTAPSYPFKLTSVPLCATAVTKGHGSLQDKYFTVTIWDKDTGDKIWSKDYSWQIYGDASDASTVWHDIQIPGVIVNRDFLIEVVTYSDAPFQKGGSSATMIGDTSTMNLDFETTKEVTRSSVSLNGKRHPNSTWTGNWYIRATGYVPLQ